MKLKRFGVGLAAMTFAAGMVPFSAMAAESNCDITDGIAQIDGAPCIVNESVSGVHYTGTIGGLGDVMFAFAKNAGFGFSNIHGSIEATITDAFSTEQITWLDSLTPEINENVVLNPQENDFVYVSLPFSMPDGYSLNLSNKVLHLPAGTSVADAFRVYKSYNDETLVVAINGEDYNNISFDSEPSRDVDVIHLDPEATVVEALEVVSAVKDANPDTTFAVASAMNYWIKFDASLEKPEIYVLDGGSLQSALDAEGVDKVYAHRDLEVDAFAVPEGKTFEVLDGVTVALPAGGEVSGNITGEGKVTIGGIEYGESETIEQEMSRGKALTETAGAYAEFETPIEGDVSLGLNEVELTDGLKDQSEYLKAVYDISVVDNGTGDKVVVKDNDITIYLTLNAEDYEGMNYFKVVYLNADGKIAEEFDPEVLKDDEQERISLKFNTSHLSLYGVLASETEFPEASTPDTGAFTGSSSMAGGYHGLVATVSVMTVLMVVMEVAMWKKRQN